MARLQRYRWFVIHSAIIVLAALSGCDNRDECQKARDHLAECLDQPPSAFMGECDQKECGCDQPSVRCISQCINSADCAAITDSFSGTPTAVSKSLLDCANQCALAK
ncbi:MAG: hypothetical protein U0359_23345 [Byssovorax sp.]